MTKLIRITTAPISLKLLLQGQMKFMSENGFEVIMVSSSGPEWKEIYDRENCRYHIVAMTRKITPVSDLKSLWQLYRFFRKEKPEIVHSHTPKAGLLAMIAARMAGVKIRIHTVAGLRFVTKKGIVKHILILMERITGYAASHIWPNSYSLLEYIQVKRIVSAKKLKVIGKGSSNGIDLARFTKESINEAELQKVGSKFNIDNKKFNFLCIGRIVKDKGINELVSAFCDVYELYKDARLILAGAYEDDLDPVSESNKRVLESHPAIILTGWTEQAEYLMCLASVLVHPSHREGFPNVLLQAGAMGCPVICSRIDGNRDIIEHKDTGLLFDVKNSASLREQMLYALNNYSEMENMAFQLRRKIRENYDRSVVQKAILEEYKRLLNV